ncbi:hypothetical protein KPL70_016652 [Citrus sinensis]|nr:hypothetical protein KPL70_016652 [Citrus sinensis]
MAPIAVGGTQNGSVKGLETAGTNAILGIEDFDIFRYKTQEYSHTAVNKFNVMPDSLIGNVSHTRMDFCWFCLGNCAAILSSLATPEQAAAIMDLVKSRWEELVGKMPLRICYPPIESHELRIVTGCDPNNTKWSHRDGGSWPACINTGWPQIARRAAELAESRMSKDHWPEYYDGKHGRYVGKQACEFQTWSIAGFLVAKIMLEDHSLLGVTNNNQMKGYKTPIHAAATWVRRQPPKIKIFLAVITALAALVFLRMVVEDHDSLFVVAEAAHAIGISVLIYKLTKERTCAGLSLKSQELTAIFLAVRLYCSFVMEYDIHTLLDSATLVTTLWVIYMMRFKLRASYMDDKDNFAIYYVLIPCAVLSFLIHPSTHHHLVNRISWAFCVYLEAVSVLPQLRVMQNTKIVEPFTAHYVFALGVARFLSCAHWILQVLDTRGRLLTALGYGLWPSMVLLSEIVQTFILADFCYYYVKRWVLSINLLYTVKVPNLKFQAILYNVILLQPYWWTTCSATSIWSGLVKSGSGPGFGVARDRTGPDERNARPDPG